LEPTSALCIVVLRITAATFLRNAQISKGTLFLLNGFAYTDDRIEQILHHFEKKLQFAKDASIDTLVQDLRVSYISNKHLKSQKVPLDLNLAPKAYRLCSLQGILQSISLIE